MYSRQYQVSEGAIKSLKARAMVADFRQAVGKVYGNVHLFDDIWFDNRIGTQKDNFYKLLRSIDCDKDSPEEILVMVYDFYSSQAFKESALLQSIRDVLMERVGVKNRWGLFFTYSKADTGEQAERQMAKYIFDLKVEMGYPVRNGKIDDTWVMMRRM